MYVYIKGACPWLDEPMKGYIQKHVPDAIFSNSIETFPEDIDSVFQYCDGWYLNKHFHVLNRAKNGLINAYPNSDALARKDLLSRVVEYWTAKRPDSILTKHSPLTVRVSLDYSEYVDDSLAAADDLTLLYSLEENEAKDASEREWWILKPALIDCGHGIRIFSTIDELASNLELAANLEDDEDTSEEQSELNGKPSEVEKDNENPHDFAPTLSIPGLDSLDGLISATGNISLDGRISDKRKQTAEVEQYVDEETGRIASAQMREFVAQRYIVSIPPIDGRKWHVRAYVTSVGRMKVHVFKEMLLLLALEDYQPPWENPSLKSSLTNTALQSEDEFISKESMRDFWEAPDNLFPSGDWKKDVFDQACKLSAELLRAAAYTMADKFMPLNNCVELFAIDFLVDSSCNAWLLEVNEAPAFYEQGYAGDVALRLMDSLVCIAMEHMGKANMDDAENVAARERWTEVLDETETLAKSNIREILPEI